MGSPVQPTKADISNTCGAVMAETLSASAAYGRAYGMMRSDIGRQACAEGWQIQLFEFFVKHGRRPDVHEQAALRAEAARLAEERRGWSKAIRRIPAIAVAIAAHKQKSANLERIANGLE